MTLAQLQLQMGDVERINKETGELSASGELAVPLELKGGMRGPSCGPQLLLQALRERLEALGTCTQPASDHTDEHVTAEQREDCLLRVLPLYIQVCQSGVRAEGLDLKGLAALTADTVVSNVYSRLEDRPAEDARYEVVRFLQRPSGETDGEMDGETDGKKDGETDRETDRETDGETDREMDRETDGEEKGEEKGKEKDKEKDEEEGEEKDKEEGEEKGEEKSEEKGEEEGEEEGEEKVQEKGQEKGSAGWLLLKSLSFLTAENSDTLSELKPGLPAALVKCLYLLVCLPAREEDVAREETFQELLTQVLLQLCRRPLCVEEMLDTQELHCLIISLTTLWEQISAPWRRQASRVLRAVSAAKARNTVPNLQAKTCVRFCIQNLLRISADIPGPVLAQVAVAVFSFIGDSYALNPALFTEFHNNNGYAALENILKRCEEGVSVDQFQPVEDLLSLVASLTLLGRSEVKVALCVSNPQPPGFKFDPPLTKGHAVKNLQAFLLLQSSFLRSSDPLLCCQILRTLRSLWEWDTANFFLLEWAVQSLARLAACVWRKAAPVHQLFFSLLEMVVFQLNYIPHETLRAVLAVLKQSWTGTIAGGVAGAEFGVAALSCFHRMAVCSGLLAEVLSDGGILELLLTELRRRAKVLRKVRAAGSRAGPQEQSCVEDSDRALTNAMLQLVSALTLRSVRNTVSVQALGMVPYMKVFLDEEQFRGATLSVLEQLAEVNPEEFMSTAVGALCSSTQQELRLKHDLLQSVLKVLESPNCCDAFRRAGGFTGLLSLMVDMEGALADPPRTAAWGPPGQQGVLDLLLLTLHTLALAVRLHPVNAHHFQTGGLYERLAEALLQLGCFQAPTGGPRTEGHAPGGAVEEDEVRRGRSFHQFLELTEAPSSSSIPPSLLSSDPQLPPSLRICIRLLSYLGQFATGANSPGDLSLVLGGGDAEHRRAEGEGETPNGEAGGPEGPQSMEDPQGRARKAAVSVAALCPYRFTCDHTILHPGGIRVIMTLLPCVFTAEDPQLSLEVQYSVAHHIQAMVKSERNRQIMCEGGLVSTLLTHCGGLLLAPDHPLHLPVTRILEKLSSQAITTADLRRFLCLGDPLMCLADKMSLASPPESSISNGQDTGAGGWTQTGGGGSSVKTLKRSYSLLNSPAPHGSCASSLGSPLPLHQIISLVSMSSPRGFRPHRVSSSPAFVEFDMSDSGYGCLFLPSLATVKGVNAEAVSTGGIGGECRGFPPAAGLSYSCWFQINRFSAACDSHPIRLLSVVRHMSRAEQQYVCLSISFSAYDGCLVVSTEEEAFTFMDMMETEPCAPSALPAALRFRCSSLLVPGQWHHLAVVMAKDLKKSCRVSAYLNGKPVGTAKMRYIQPFPGQYVSMDPTAVIDVCALIGTPSLWKEHAELVWRVGPTYLFEEALGPEAVRAVYVQGTAYLGNFLALRNMGPGCEPDAAPLPLRLVPEERISFGINPAIATVTTVAQIREDYNEVDCRLIAHEVGIPSRDSSTPVFLARNISQHLSGTARTIGAALVGHSGVRTFTPRSAANCFLYVGGPTVILSLVAMAPDDASLYAAVKVLLSVLETSAAMQQEMSRINGYKLLAFLLKMKSGLVSSRTFQLVLSLSGSVELGSGSACIRNTPAFQALLCNLEVWQSTSDNLDLSVLNHFTEILRSSSDERVNAEVMHGLGLLPKLLFLLSDPTVTFRKVKLIACIITRLLKGHFTTRDVCRLGLFLVYTLPPRGGGGESSGIHDSCPPGDTTAQNSDPASLVWIRNQLLLSLCELLDSESPLTMDQQKAVFQTLGSDWFLLFLHPHLHPSTLQLGLLLLTHLLANQSQQDLFREGVSTGSLIGGMEEPFVVLDNLRARSQSSECLTSVCPGFEALGRLLVGLPHLPEVYGALAALLLGKRTSHPAGGEASHPTGGEASHTTGGEASHPTVGEASHTTGGEASHPAGGEVNLDEVLQSVLDHQADAPTRQLCPEAAAILLDLVKVIITKRWSADGASWELKFPGSVMQFLCLLHSLRPREPLWASPQFLHTLAGVVFPTDTPEDGIEVGLESEEEPVVEEEEEEEEVPKCHPTRKQVCDFIQILLMDSLLNVPPDNNTHPLLLLLEFSPEGASLEQRQSFQTELLECLMDIILMISLEEGSNTHLNSQDPSSQTPVGQTAILMENVAFFSKILVKKLHRGMFLGEPGALLSFLSDQIVVALEKGQAQRERVVSVLYSCSNRVLLYFLSHSRRSPAGQEMVVKTLRVLLERWDVVMATYNANVTFITCLLHCLLLIRSGSYPEGFGCEVQKDHRRRSIRHMFPLKTNRSASLSTELDSAEPELMSLVEACWSKLMTERRHTLEDFYKIELSANQTGRAEPLRMTDISPLWEETAHKSWQIYTDSQKKKLVGSPHKKLGLISSAVRSAQRILGKEATGTAEEFLSCMEAHRQRGHCVFETMRKNYLQLCGSELEQVSARWLRVEGELLRERAVFGPGPGVVLTRGWVQDAAEGPNRTRTRIRRQAQRRSKRVPGSLGLCLRAGVPEKNRSGTETDAEPRILCETGSETKEEEEEGRQDCDRLTFFPALNETPTAAPEAPVPESAPEPCSHMHTCPDTHIILQALGPGEEVKCKLCVVVVSGLSVMEGVLLFGQDSLYVCVGFTLSPNGDVCCRKHHPSSVKESFLSSDQPPVSCRRLLYEDIKEARFTRFLLEDNSLEIFMRNGLSVFLVFLHRDHVSAYKRLCSVVPSLKGRGVAEVIANARKSPVVGKTALLKWQKGEMSNFEYLMHLNTLAGRTYNDLMQYPVFPWVLADYQSETLDLSNPATFRDLSKPMGAQTEKRKESFIERYEEVENSEGQGDLMFLCHYFTHYSSASSVASFLVRMEPFLHTFQTLQGGLDVPDRMFHSIQKEWESASRDNMTDVRELLPEFYYLPDFLVNSNHIQLGCMQDGTRLGDVVLPLWAKDDPQEFIRIHREALECDYVSAHLHLWIDLIFGHRQQGPAAVESTNTFHPYFYAQRPKGNQDAPAADPLVMEYVSKFGQVPKQLFTKAHPPRGCPKKEGSSPPQPTPFFFKLDQLKPSVQPFKELLRGPVGQVVCAEKEVLVLERNSLLLSPLSHCYFSWGFPDNSCAFANYGTEKPFAVCESLCDWGETLCAACPNQDTIITAGTSTVVCVWDVAVNKDKLTHMKLKQALYGHTADVTCLAVSEAHGVIVSGSTDLTCILWDLEELCYVTQLPGHQAGVTALAINQLTGEIVSCAGPLLYLWTMKGELLTWLDPSCGPKGDILCACFTQRHEWDARNVLVTGCADGLVRIWRTEYARTQLPPEEPVSPGQEQTESDGVSGRGKSWERHLVMCRELNRSQVVSRRRYKTNPAITALAMSRTHATLLVGDAWGRVFTWTCE